MAQNCCHHKYALYGFSTPYQTPKLTQRLTTFDIHAASSFPPSSFVWRWQATPGQRKSFAPDWRAYGCRGREARAGHGWPDTSKAASFEHCLDAGSHRSTPQVLIFSITQLVRGAMSRMAFATPLTPERRSRKPGRPVMAGCWLLPETRKQAGISNSIAMAFSKRDLPRIPKLPCRISGGRVLRAQS